MVTPRGQVPGRHNANVGLQREPIDGRTGRRLARPGHPLYRHVRRDSLGAADDCPHLAHPDHQHGPANAGTSPTPGRCRCSVHNRDSRAPCSPHSGPNGRDHPGARPRLCQGARPFAHLSGRRCRDPKQTVSSTDRAQSRYSPWRSAAQGRSEPLAASPRKPSSRLGKRARRHRGPSVMNRDPCSSAGSAKPHP
jgi:hypothetical protein